jgi:hypothetical protein
MGPNIYQMILIAVIAILWLGVGNLILLDVTRKKKISWMHMLTPYIFSKFDAKDWGKFILLIAVIVGLSCLIILLE